MLELTFWVQNVVSGKSRAFLHRLILHMAIERSGGRDAAAEHVRQAPDGNVYPETEWAAWRRDAAEEHARLGAMERRRAANGQAYTADEFRAWYQAGAQKFGDNAPKVRKARDGRGPEALEKRHFVSTSSYPS